MLNRRTFLSWAGLAGAGLALAQTPLARASRLQSGLDGWQPGTAFEVAGVGRLRLVAVDDHSRCARCTTTRLGFVVEQEEGGWTEGPYRLRGPRGFVDLFLQPGQQGPVAWLNLLA